MSQEITPGARRDRLDWTQEEEARSPRIFPPIPEAILEYQITRARERRLAERFLTDAIVSKTERRILIQKDGRMSETAWKLLDIAMETAGVPMSKEERAIRGKDRKPLYMPQDSNLKIIPVKSRDIGLYIKEGYADMAIVGEDQRIEQDIETETVFRLGEAECSLVIAVPEDSPIQEPEDLNGKLVATTLPRLLNAYAREEGLIPRALVLNGSLEAAAVLKIADAICDLEETGESIRKSGLRRIANPRDFEAVLIAKYP